MIRVCTDLSAFRRWTFSAMITDQRTMREFPFGAAKCGIFTMTWMKVLAFCLVALPLLVALRLALPYPSADRTVGFDNARILEKVSQNGSSAGKGMRMVLKFLLSVCLVDKKIYGKLKNSLKVRNFTLFSFYMSEFIVKICWCFFLSEVKWGFSLSPVCSWNFFYWFEKGCKRAEPLIKSLKFFRKKRDWIRF